MEVRRYGALETHCRCNDMGIKRSGSLEVWSRAAGVEV